MRFSDTVRIILMQMRISVVSATSFNVPPETSTWKTKKTMIQPASMAAKGFAAFSMAGTYTFSRMFLPNRPEGLKIRMRISTAKATPSRHME
ncbi:hypothetical protein D3C87_1770640 [compost metagenome]